MVLIHTWPKHQHNNSIKDVLREMGYTRNEWAYTCESPIEVAYNLGFQKLLAVSSAEWFVVCDNDLTLGPTTHHWLEPDADVVCIQYPGGPKQKWALHRPFHSGMYRIHRSVIQTIPPPWFLRPLSPDGCAVKGCPCGYFRDKVLAAGFSLECAGWADHPEGQTP